MIDARILTHLEVSAASGLVVDGDGLWIIADDVPALLRHDLEGRLLKRIPFEGSWNSTQHHLPKTTKPDVESLLLLPDGDLLALGSGSRPSRCRGFRLDRQHDIRPVDLSPLYASLANRLPALNIEGAAILRNDLVLAHRGVDGEDALIYLHLQDAIPALDRGYLDDKALHSIQRLQLGSLHGTRLTFTDLATHPDGTLWFSAAAEATADPYEDGAVHGSVIGSLDADLQVQRLEEIRPALKVEGLHWLAAAGQSHRWLAVADADDPQQRSPLLELVIS